MPLSTSISVKQGVTSFTITGGTDTPFINDGQGLNGKKTLVNSSQSDPSLRSKIITDVTIGSIQSNGNAKLHRANITVHQPYVGSNGSIFPLPDNLSFSFHPSMTAAERVAKMNNVFAIALDAELANLAQLIND